MTKRWGLLLAPGAGGSSDSSALLAIEALAPPEVVVRRMDFPYRLAGKKLPDGQPVLIDALVSEARRFAREKRIAMNRIFLGGRSMGGRMASIAVAEGLGAAGLVLVSYPLHPPGKPDKLRTEHFPDITVPTLFVTGTNDPFGTRTELRRHTKQIPAPVHHEWLPGGDHGLKRFDEATATAVSRWLSGMLREG